MKKIWRASLLVITGTLILNGCLTPKSIVHKANTDHWMHWANRIVESRSLYRGTNALGPIKFRGANKHCPKGCSTSLGGGGFLVLAFDGPVWNGPGDDLVTFEAGATYTSDRSGQPATDPYDVWVIDGAFTDENDPKWIRLGAGSDESSFDLDSVGLKKADFVMLTDKSFKTQTTEGTNTSGADIDGVFRYHLRPPS